MRLGYSLGVTDGNRPNALQDAQRLRRVADNNVHDLTTRNDFELHKQ